MRIEDAFNIHEGKETLSSKASQNLFVTFFVKIFIIFFYIFWQFNDGKCFSIFAEICQILSNIFSVRRKSMSNICAYSTKQNVFATLFSTIGHNEADLNKFVCFIPDDNIINLIVILFMFL